MMKDDFLCGAMVMFILCVVAVGFFIWGGNPKGVKRMISDLKNETVASLTGYDFTDSRLIEIGNRLTELEEAPKWYGDK